MQQSKRLHQNETNHLAVVTKGIPRAAGEKSSRSTQPELVYKG